MSRHSGMRMNADASATYKKLDDGTWGVWTDLQDLRPGKSITVTTRSGQPRLEKLASQVWTDGRLSLWRIKQAEGEHDG